MSDQPNTNKLSLPRWLAPAGVFLALAGAAAIAYFLLLREDYAVLYQDLREDDAAAVARELGAQHVRYRLANGGADILVPASNLDQVRLDIASSDVAIEGLEGFELFDQSDMGLTDFAQRIKYQRALQGELARTIMRMDGVVDARVHISMPERTLFRSERRNAEAAVAVVTRRAQDLTPARVVGIQRLIAASVPDLASSDVVVLDGRGAPITGTDPIQAQQQAYGPLREFEALARQAAHRAIPYQSFDVVVAIEPPSLYGASEEANLPPTILYTIITPFSLNSNEQARIRSEFARAGLFTDTDPAHLRFERGSVTAPSSRVPAPTPLRTGEEPAPPHEAELAPYLVWAAVVGALLLGLFWGWRGLRSRLSRVQQRSFAERMQASLQSSMQEAHDAQ